MSKLSEYNDQLGSMLEVLEKAAETTDIDRIATLRTSVEEAINAGTRAEATQILQAALDATIRPDMGEATQMAQLVFFGAKGGFGDDEELETANALVARFEAIKPKSGKGSGAGSRGPRDPNAPRVSKLDFPGAWATITRTDNGKSVSRNPNKDPDKGVKWNDLRYYALELTGKGTKVSLLSDVERAEWDGAYRFFKSAGAGEHSHTLTHFGVRIDMTIPERVEEPTPVPTQAQEEAAA